MNGSTPSNTRQTAERNLHDKGQQQTAPSPSSKLRIALDSYSSAWFLIPQGTGILAITLHQLDYPFNGLETISVVVWLAALVLLALTSVVYMLHLASSRPLKKAFDDILSTTNEAACLASLSVAFMAVVQMTALVVVPGPEGGRAWALVVYGLWWANCVLALSACFFIPLIFLYSVHGQGGFIECWTPTTHLPLIALLTSAAGAGTIASVASDYLTPGELVPMLLVGYLEVGVGVPLSLLFDGLYLARVLGHWKAKPLQGSQIFSDFVSCGPWGQGSFALQVLGSSLLQLSTKFPSFQHGQSSGILLTSDSLRSIGFLSIMFGLLLWGQGTFWWFLAVCRVSHSLFKHMKGRTRLRFSAPAWAIVFPWVGLILSSTKRSTDSDPGRLCKCCRAIGQRDWVSGLQNLVYCACARSCHNMAHLCGLHFKGNRIGDYAWPRSRLETENNLNTNWRRAYLSHNYVDSGHPSRYRSRLYSHRLICRIYDHVSD